MYKGMIAGAYWIGKPNGEPNKKKIDKNIKLAEKIAIKLWNEGFGIFTPHLNTRHFEIKTNTPESKYREFYLEMIKYMDFLFVLPNWEKSSGTRKEIKKAIAVKTPIFDNIEILKNWANKDDSLSQWVQKHNILSTWGRKL